MISSFDPGTEFLTPERCYIVEIQNCAHDPACSIARARVAPGVTTQLHALHDTDERYVLLHGQAEIEVGGGPSLPVKPLDVVLIPAGSSQRITNTGDGDLIFLCVCTPRFNSANYINLERPGG